jgi:hypothetical protein
LVVGVPPPLENRAASASLRCLFSARFVDANDRTAAKVQRPRRTSWRRDSILCEDLGNREQTNG